MTEVKNGNNDSLYSTQTCKKCSMVSMNEFLELIILADNGGPRI